MRITINITIDDPDNAIAQRIADAIESLTAAAPKAEPERRLDEIPPVTNIAPIRVLRKHRGESSS